jgi:hypothetical protein
MLAATKMEFESFDGLMDRVERNIGTIQNTLRAVGTPRSAVLGGSADVVVVLASQDGLCSVQPQQWQCVTRAKLSAQDDSTDVSK